MMYLYKLTFEIRTLTREKIHFKILLNLSVSIQIMVRIL